MSDLTITSRRVPANRGMAWFQEAWALFLKAPWPLLALPIVALLGNICLGWMPLVGAVLQVVFGMAVTFGSVAAVAQLERTGEFRWQMLLEPVRTKFFDMLLFSVLMILPWVIGLAICGGIAFATVVGDFSAYVQAFSDLFSDNPAASFPVLGQLFTVGFILPLVIVGAIAGYLTLCMQFFGPALISVGGADAWTAAKFSVKAVSKNVWPMTVFGLVSLGLLLVAIIPFGLGLIVYYPMGILVAYKSYQDIFVGAVNGSDIRNG